MRILLALAVLVVLSLPATGAPPKSAEFVLDGVKYVYITGVNGTSRAVLNTEAGEVPLDLKLCAFVQLHPPTTNGVARFLGLQGDFTPIGMRVDQFRLDNGSRGYAYDQAVTEDGVSSFADLAVNGNGTLNVLAGRYHDPVSSSGDGDADKEDPDLKASIYLLRDGVRAATGQILDEAQRRDAELHLHMRSSPEAVPETISHTFQSPGTVTPPTEAYGATHQIPNLKLGGQARIALSATAYAAPGMNQISFRVLSPSGNEVANATLEPAVLADDAATLEFPLLEFGNYVLRVSGSMALSSYSAQVTLSPPADFDLHIWWENVTYGHQGYLDYKACTELNDSPNAVIGTDRVIARPPPPQLRMGLVVFGVVAGIAVVTTAIKLASDQISLTSFRKSK